MPGPSQRLRLAELLCARITHDLAGLTGTVSAALDLAGDPALGEEALAIARQAAAELRQRLELQRAGWGPTGASSITLPALRGLTAVLLDAPHHTLDLSGLAPDTAFAPAFARALLNLLLLAVESLHGEGEITLAGGSNDVVIAIAGPHAGWPSGLVAWLGRTASEWAALHDASSLQAPFTVMLARALGLRLSFPAPDAQAGGLPPLRLSEA